MILRCHFCGAPVEKETYPLNAILDPEWSKVSCGKCTSYCTKICELGKSGQVKGWHYEPCLSCDKNPYKVFGLELDNVGTEDKED